MDIPIYSGNPIEGITYFKKLAERVDASESECGTCGNTNPDEILNIIEASGMWMNTGPSPPSRKTSPSEWYRHYQEKIESVMKFQFGKELDPL